MASPARRSRRPVIVSNTPLSEPELPLHLALSYLLVRVFPHSANREESNVYSAIFTSSILEIVAREVFELSDSALEYSQLRDDVDRLVKPETASIASANEKIRSRGQKVSEDRIEAESSDSWLGAFGSSFETVSDGCAFLDNLEKDIRERINEDEEVDLAEIQEPIERTSPLGIFLRRIILTLRKLSFDETAHLAQQVAQWCGVTPAGPSRNMYLWSLNRKLAMEDTMDRRVSAMQKFQSASASGDYSGALASLRRFYDYQFPTSGRGQHQHALLNLASFHYATGGLVSAKEAVDEAIRVARAEGDKACLRRCMSLLHQLNAETESSAFEPSETPRIGANPISNGRIPKAATPMDELWSLTTALDLGEPVHIAIRRIYLALARYEHTHIKSDDKREPREGWTARQSFDEGAWHAAQASLWTMMGSNNLAELHEDMALTCGDVNGDSRVSILLSRAERLAIQAEYEHALALLLDYASIDDMSITSYHRWARLIWSILRKQAIRSVDTETLNIIDSLHTGELTSRRIGPGGPMRDISSAGQLNSSDSSSSPSQIVLVHEEIRSSLRNAQKMQTSDTPPFLILPHVLSAIHLSAKLSLWPLYRLGIINLSEVLLSMQGQGMASKAIEQIESVWQEVLGSGDEEMVARASLLLGKAKVEIALDSNSHILDKAVEHVQRALRSARRLQSRALIAQCTTLLALIADLQRKPTEAIKAQVEWRNTQMGDSVQLHQIRDRVRKIGEIVKLVGVRIAEGWK